MKAKLLTFLLLSITGFSLVFNTVPVTAQPLRALSAYDIVAAVNALRASNGAGALQINGSLMSAAQGQSDYQASIDSWSHSGPGGSRPIDRAAAAGYGGGAKIYISENVAYLSADADMNTLIYSIWADSVHWNTMINPSYTDCGVGVAETGGFVYYTLDVGYVSGAAGSGSSGTGSSGVSLTPSATLKPGEPSPTPNLVKAVQVATPAADVSIWHVVQAGQALSSIAVAYEVKIASIRAYNNLAENDNTLWVGQKLLIRPAFTPTVSPTASNTPPPPTRTLAPSHTPAPPTLTPTKGPSITPTSRPLLPQLSNSMENNPRQSVGIILVVVCGLGLAGVLASNFLKKK
ncbi:MAG: CAP domain-containing protein [Anaerolineae bacterium]|nr:CAP domain-containing protein [Anaerolineae bacterium]